MSLRDPFEVVHEKGGFDYISWSQAADRLDDEEPGWSFAIMSMGADWAHGRLSFADGRFYENVGYAENASADWKKEPLKDAVSDAFKRCAAMAGVARYLYDKTATEAPAARPQAPQRPVPARTSTAVPDDPYGDELDFDGAVAAAPKAEPTGWVCRIHGTSKVVPAGVSSRTGKPYDAFLSCTERDCNEKPPRNRAA